MRRLAIVILLICCTSAFAQKGTREKGAPPQPATKAYFDRVGAIILKALGPELAKHRERLGGAVKVSLFINAPRSYSESKNHLHNLEPLGSGHRAPRSLHGQSAADAKGSHCRAGPRASAL